MISEKTLRRWRKASLDPLYNVNSVENPTTTSLSISHFQELHERILRMTQELLDQHLIRKVGNLW